jgi:hypothetical protein
VKYTGLTFPHANKGIFSMLKLWQEERKKTLATCLKSMKPKFNQLASIVVVDHENRD